MRPLSAFLTFIAVGLSPAIAAAQLAPGMGYVYPPGGPAGATVDVLLGGYDWTPDMQVFVLDPRVKLEITGPPGPVIVPEPPYWFEKKARRGPFPMPREFPARLTLPADMPAGVVEWQAANANGATTRGRFIVGTGSEIVEVQDRTTPQELPTLPVTVSGRIQKIEEVDRYLVTAPRTGPITCRVSAQQIGSPLNAVVEVRDAEGRLVADAADTAGRDVVLTFAATEGARYTVSLYDVDFRGNRAYVYRLSIVPGPAVLAAIPAAGKAGETRPVEFVGYGVATGGSKLESVTANVAFPAVPINDAAAGETFHYALETPWGAAPPFPLRVSDLPETVEPATNEVAARRLAVPAAVTGVIEERYGADRYVVSGKMGEVWSIAALASRIGSPLDVALTIHDAEGKQVGAIDDMPGTVDAALEFTLPADGDYEIAVGDSSGHSGSRAAVYRLVVRPAAPSFELSVPELLAVPGQEKAQLAVTAKRHGGFNEPIAIAVAGLPEGVEAAKDIMIPAGQNAANIELTSAAGSPSAAALVEVTGTATIEGNAVTRSAGRSLVAVTLKPPFSVDAEGQDDVTKWPRGSTFPGPVLIERDAGFEGEILLEMSARQGRHRQGIRGPELVVPPGVKRILYPVFLPEWLETTRTSRMVVNGVARVPDARGNVRYSVSKLKTRIGFLPTGALLKISPAVNELEVQPGQPFDVRVSVSRAGELTEPLRLELQPGQELDDSLTADPVVVEPGATEAVLRVAPVAGQVLVGEHPLTVRATALQNGELPVVSEARVLLIFPGGE